MLGDQNPRRFTVVAIILHWVIALGIAFLGIMGFAMRHLMSDPMRQFQAYQMHKSVGVTMLGAVILRLLWRVSHEPPKLPEKMPAIEKKAAEVSHAILYTLMLALPLSGWALVSASVLAIPTVLYGVVPWPDLPILSTLENKEPVEAILKLVHACAAYLMIGLIVAHAVAALRHHFVLRDDVLARMLPLLSRHREKTEHLAQERSTP